MKKLCYALLFFGIPTVLQSQTQITASVIPQYSVASSTVSSQMMTVCRMTLTGLTPGLTYKYVTGISTNPSELLNAVPTGGMFMINDQPGSPSVDIVGYTESKKFTASVITAGEWNTSATGRCAEFYATGTTYTGWFCAVNNNPASLGQPVYFYVYINDGLNGTTAARHFRSAQSMTGRDFSTGTNGGVAVTYTSIASSEQIVALYDNTGGTGAPLFIGWTENDGIPQQWSTWYNSAFLPATSAPGKWAGWIPNSSANGLKSVSYYDGSGNVQFRMIDGNNDGFYNSFGVKTVDANSGTTPLQIDGLNQIEKLSILRTTDLQRDMKLNLFSPNGQIELYADLNVKGYSLTLNSLPITDPSSGGYKINMDNTSTLVCSGTDAVTLPSYFSVVKNLSVSNPSGVKLSAPLIVENQLDLSSSFGNGKLDIGNQSLTLKGPAITPANAPGLTSTGGQGTLVFDGNATGVYIPSQLNDIKNLAINNPNGVYMNAAVTVKNSLTFSNNALINNKTFSLNIEGSINGQGGQNLSATEQVLIDNPAKLLQTIQGTFSVITCNSPVVLSGNLTAVNTLSVNRPFNISDFKLTIKKDWSGDPSFVSGGVTSSIEFAGSAPQVIPTTANIYNIGSLIINNNTTVSLNKNASLARSLELLKGTLLDGGNVITLAGDIKGSATVDGAGKIIMTGGATTQYISDANINNLELNNNKGFELNGTFTGNTTITNRLNLVAGTLNVKDKGLFFTGSNASPVVRTNGNIQVTKLSSLGFGSKTIKNTGAAYSLPPNMFVKNSTSPTRSGNAVELGSFILNRSNPITLEASQQFDIHKLLSIVEGELILPNSYQLDMKSNSIAETAMFDIISNPLTSKITYGTNSFVCVERFIPRDVDGGVGRRAFRDLAPAVVNTIGSMWSNWQEGAPSTPVPGVGTHITGKKGPLGVNDAATGLDQTLTGEASVRTYWTNTTTGLPAWANITSTKSIEFNGLLPYRVLIRGDRNYNDWYNVQITNNVVRLRAKGRLAIGDVNITATGASVPSVGFSTPTMRMNSASATGYTMIANPYAAPVSWTALKTHNPTVVNYYTVLDPNINVLGGYVSYMPGVGPNIPTSMVSDVIQPGQAFFVRNNNLTSSSFNIRETDKVIDHTKLTNVFKTSNTQKQSGQIPRLKLTLSKAVSGQEVIADGAVVAYSNEFNDAIDINDVVKWMSAENNMSVLRGTKEISIETRKNLPVNDTVPLQLSLLSSGVKYKIAVQLEELSLAQKTDAFLYDALTGNQTYLDKAQMNSYEFTPTTAENSFKNRFAVIFRTAQVLPVTFTNFTAYKKDKGVQLSWNVSEKDIKEYIVYRSSDAKNFAALQTVKSAGEGNYSYVCNDNAPESINYYKIGAISNDGSATYTSVAKVSFDKKEEQGLQVYPNPAANFIILNLGNLTPNRSINIRIINSEGKLILNETINSQGSSITKQLNVSTYPSGRYLVEVIGDKMSRQFLEILR